MLLKRSTAMQVLDYNIFNIIMRESHCIPASSKMNSIHTRYGFSLLYEILFMLVVFLSCPMVYGFGTLENQAPEIRFSNDGEWSNSPYTQEIIRANDLIFEDDNVSPLAINRFWIVDVDSIPDELLVTLELRVHGSNTAIISSNNVGSISLSTVDGLRHPTDPSWTGQNEQSMTFYGEYMDSSYTPVLHNALDDLRFSPHPDFIGRVDLYIYVNDEGHNGAYVNNLPDKKSDSDTVVINVIPSAINLVGAEEDTAFPITYDDIAEAAFPAQTNSLMGEYAGERVTFYISSIESTLPGTLTKDNINVVDDGTVMIADGDPGDPVDTIVWHPEANATGNIHAFNVVFRDIDGWESSSIPVYIDVQSNNEPPVVILMITKTLYSL